MKKLSRFSSYSAAALLCAQALSPVVSADPRDRDGRFGGRDRDHDRTETAFVNCGSWGIFGRGRASCPVNNGDSLVISVQVSGRPQSNAKCIEGQSFGKESNAIWVDDGCRATFEVKYVDLSRRPIPQPRPRPYPVPVPAPYPVPAPRPYPVPAPQPYPHPVPAPQPLPGLPAPMTSQPIELFNGDYCSTLVGYVDTYTSCDRLSDRTVESVRINGSCINLADTTERAACSRVKGAFQVDGSSLYTGDYCGPLVAVVGPYTYSSELASYGDQVVESVRLSSDPTRSCINIKDTNLEDATRRFNHQPTMVHGFPYPIQAPRMENPQTLKFYTGDYCSNLIGLANESTSCSSLSGTVVESIRLDGVCINITDTNEQAACGLFKAANDPAATWIYSGDYCSTPVGVVNRMSSCAELAQYSPNTAEAIRMSGRSSSCQNIQDMSFLDACYRFGGR